MKILILVIAAVFAVVIVPMQMSVGDLMPTASPQLQERLLGFAELQGFSCQWKVPTVWDYVRGGRPELRPNAVCTLRQTVFDKDPHQQSLEIRATVFEQVQRFFTEQELILGFRTNDKNSILLCYTPQKTIAWTRCTGNPNLGCLFAGCTIGLPPL